MTTQDDIREWFLAGTELAATHLIVVCDTFDHEDYPVYVKEIPGTGSEQAGYQRVQPVSDVRAFVTNNYSGQNMQRTMEVYKLSDPMEEQLRTPRCFRY